MVYKQCDAFFNADAKQVGNDLNTCVKTFTHILIQKNVHARHALECKDGNRMQDSFMYAVLCMSM